jgi:hypothetical protein
VAQKTSWRWSKKANHEKRWFYYENQMQLAVPPGETVSGFVFANRSRGVRWVLVEVFSEHDAVHIEFVHEIPGFRADFHKLEGGDLYGRSTPIRRSLTSRTRKIFGSGSKNSRPP